MLEKQASAERLITQSDPNFFFFQFSWNLRLVIFPSFFSPEKNLKKLRLMVSATGTPQGSSDRPRERGGLSDYCSEAKETINTQEEMDVDFLH